MSHVLIQDPSNISTRFSNNDRLGAESEISIEDLIERQLAPAPEEDLIAEGYQPDFGVIEHHLNRIPERETDLIVLYYRDKMKQEQIARIFGITQAAVSYRLHRGIKRIQFLRTIPELEFDEFELELGPKFSDQDREILWLMYETTCQSEIAKRLKLTQGRVRHRFFRALNKIRDLIAEEAREREVNLQLSRRRGLDITPEKIKQEVEKTTRDSRYGKYWTVFFAISDKHFNILHEVSLPQFVDRGIAQILPTD
jgi:DNA-directed RNA polymerase specialized sigma24 family protein